MKLAKLSLAAIMAMGMSVYAEVSNINFSGDAKLYYSTSDNGDSDLFDKNGAMGQAALDLAMESDVGESGKFKLSLVALNTLGLENDVVNGWWAGTATGTAWWFNEAWLAVPVYGNTVFKVGRQELDTPLAFSEKWNITSNTFDALVFVNNDLPQTTLVAAYVGRGNGACNSRVVRTTGDAGAGAFDTYGTALVNAYGLRQLGIDPKGAYAVAAVTKAIPNTTAQLWYYNVRNIADAWWFQADMTLDQMAQGLTFGAQYALISPDLNNVDDSSAWAIKFGYTFDKVKSNFAYSTADDDGVVNISNTATGARGSQSKLYTEALINYGYVGAPGAKSFHADFGYDVEDLANFNAYFTSVKDANNNTDMMELALTASKQIGNLNTTFAYIYTDADDQNGGDSYNTLQLLLTYQF
jgi:hypothetical protein